MIYIDGDSYINGDEINDHILFDDHPGYFTYNDFNRPDIRRTCEKWFHSVRTKVPHNIWLTTQDLQKQNNLSSYLKKLNYDITDNSMSGSSMAGIARRTINKLSSSSASYAIIGLTFPIRYEIYLNGWWHQISMANECTRIPYCKEFNKLRALCYSNETLLSDWEMQLHHISSVCKEKNIKLIIINPFLTNEEVFTMLVEQKTQLLSDIKYECMFSMNEIAKKLSTETTVMCPGAHYASVVHEELARCIHNFINNEERQI